MTDLEYKTQTEYIDNIKDLKKERRGILKYLGAVSGAAAALVPQLLDKIHQESLFYSGVGIPSFVLIICTIYILSSIENESDEFLQQFKEKNRMFERIKQPRRDFLSGGKYDLDRFMKTLKSESEETSILRTKSKENKDKPKSLFMPMNYIGEFVFFFLYRD
ncbi:MAG: hypothetical protein U9O20_02925 [Patescibacteria group bacterium]|nr:hypothetical protein [Patescibacteria group bacterium]